MKHFYKKKRYWHLKVLYISIWLYQPQVVSICCWSNCVCYSCSFERLYKWCLIMCTCYASCHEIIYLPIILHNAIGNNTSQANYYSINWVCWTFLAPCVLALLHVCWQQCHVLFGLFWPPILSKLSYVSWMLTNIMFLVMW